MRYLKVDYKVDRTPWVHPLGNGAGPTAVALGGALPTSPQQFGSHNRAIAPRSQPMTRGDATRAALAARVTPPPPPPQPPPLPPPQHELPPLLQPPPSLPEPELYDSLMQLHRLCGGDLTCCIDVAARVHRLPKHRVFEMLRLMSEHGAFSEVPVSTASSAGGPPPTAPVHSRLPPLPPLPPEQPATAPPAIGARVSSLAPTPRHMEQSKEHGVLHSSGDLSAAAAAAPGLPAAPPLWQPPQQPYQQQQLPMPDMPMPGMGAPQLLQPEHRQLQPQTQHERQHQQQRQPAHPALAAQLALPPQPPPRQQQQAYTHDELRGLRRPSAGQSGQREPWERPVQRATPQQGRAHMYGTPQMPQTQQTQQMQRQRQPSAEGGEGVRHAGPQNGAAAEARGGMSGGMRGGMTLAMLQARQEQLQQRQVPLVITPVHSITAAYLPLKSRSAPRARLGLCWVPMPLLAAPCRPWPRLAPPGRALHSLAAPLLPP